MDALSGWGGSGMLARVGQEGFTEKVGSAEI